MAKSVKTKTSGPAKGVAGTVNKSGNIKGGKGQSAPKTGDRAL